MPRRTAPQLAFRFRTWGGRRKGAGRKPKGAKAGVPHRPRPAISGREPLHLTLSVAPHVWNLRSTRAFKILRLALVRARNRFGLRVVQHSIQSNHVHLVVEADERASLARGVRGLAVRIARGLNAMMGRRGRVFADRYHARVLRTPREVKHCLRYVLANARHHAAQRGERLSDAWIDPYSSAAAFDGWRRAPPRRYVDDCITLRRRVMPRGASDDETAPEREVLPARRWLLRVGWRSAGLIGVAEVPAS